MGLAPESNDKNNDSTMGRDSGRTGTLNKDDTVYLLDEDKEVEGPFQKVCMGISSEVGEEKAARVLMEIFKRVFEKDKDLQPDMCIQICSKQLAPFPLLMVTADNCIVVIHGIH